MQPVVFVLATTPDGTRAALAAGVPLARGAMAVSSSSCRRSCPIPGRLTARRKRRCSPSGVTAISCTRPTARRRSRSVCAGRRTNVLHAIPPASTVVVGGTGRSGAAEPGRTADASSDAPRSSHRLRGGESQIAVAPGGDLPGDVVAAGRAAPGDGANARRALAGCSGRGAVADRLDLWWFPRRRLPARFQRSRESSVPEPWHRVPCRRMGSEHGGGLRQEEGVRAVAVGHRTARPGREGRGGLRILRDGAQPRRRRRARSFRARQRLVPGAGRYRD